MGNRGLLNTPAGESEGSDPARGGYPGAARNGPGGTKPPSGREFTPQARLWLSPGPNGGILRVPGWVWHLNPGQGPGPELPQQQHPPGCPLAQAQPGGMALPGAHRGRNSSAGSLMKVLALPAFANTRSRRKVIFFQRKITWINHRKGNTEPVCSSHCRDTSSKQPGGLWESTQSD